MRRERVSKVVHREVRPGFLARWVPYVAVEVPLPPHSPGWAGKDQAPVKSSGSHAGQDRREQRPTPAFLLGLPADALRRLEPWPEGSIVLGVPAQYPRALMHENQLLLAVVVGSLEG